MGVLRNSNWGQPRLPQSEDETPTAPTIKFENENGDMVVFTPKEAKEVLEIFIYNELELYSDSVVNRYKEKFEPSINAKLKELGDRLIKHVDNKFLKITERIIESTIDRKIEEEVERRLNERLNKLKKLL